MAKGFLLFDKVFADLVIYSTRTCLSGILFNDTRFIYFTTQVNDIFFLCNESEIRKVVLRSEEVANYRRR